MSSPKIMRALIDDSLDIFGQEDLYHPFASSSSARSYGFAGTASSSGGSVRTSNDPSSILSPSQAESYLSACLRRNFMRLHSLHMTCSIFDGSGFRTVVA
jgi:hypothetical protein